MFKVHYRKTDLSYNRTRLGSSNFYCLKEIKEAFETTAESSFEIIQIEIIKHKVLICDYIIKHKFSGFDSHISESSKYQLEFIIKSLLLGDDHIELFKLNGHWKTATETVNVLPLLDGDFSVESILFHAFDQLYPQSHFLATYLVKLIHQYNDKEITKEELLNILDHIETISFCEKQVDALNLVRNQLIK